MARLEGKVAVITGGTSGIGRATAELFVREGARVVLTGRQDDKGRTIAEALGEAALYLHADVRREEDVAAAIGLATERFGRLDCLFNNAGAPGIAGPIETIPAEAFDDAMAVLVRGAFFGIKHAAPVMKAQASGCIISNASIAGLRTGYGPHIYGAAKAAVIQLTRSVAMELAPHGVRVNSISPGFIATPIFGRSFGLSVEDADRSLAGMEELSAQQSPLDRPGLPGDIAGAALYLASDDSAFVTGHDLVVDGGMIAGRGWDETQQSFGRVASALGIER
jgi:NAD(P)-dependent dehydrogenase (short-subunit alcohol dehydrogenase family)